MGSPDRFGSESQSHSQLDFDVHFRDRSLYFPTADTLVIADTHFGRGATSRVEVPIGDGTDVCRRLETVLEAFEPETVVVAGDLLHSFSSVPRGVRDSVARLQTLAEETDTTLIVTPGNHDTTLEAVYDGAVAEEYQLDEETVVCHGHKRPQTDAERYVIGHDHPAIELEGRRYPCVLYGEGVYDGADVLACPAFTRLAPGVKINRLRTSAFQSPLVADLEAFEPIVRDEAGEKTLRFPPLGECRRLL